MVKDDLILKIKPLESKIYHASAFPVIRHLLASTINYMRNLIGNDEFLILEMKRKTQRKLRSREIQGLRILITMPTKIIQIILVIEIKMLTVIIRMVTEITIITETITRRIRNVKIQL